MPESHPFRLAVEAHDMDAVRATLRDDVVFHSPVLFRPFEGIDAAVHVITCVAGLLTDFTYLHELREGDAVCLHFKATYGEREVEGIDFLVLDDEDPHRRLHRVHAPADRGEGVQRGDGRGAGRAGLAVALGLAQGALHLALGVALADRLALVVEVLAARERDLHLGAGPLK